MFFLSIEGQLPAFAANESGESSAAEHPESDERHQERCGHGRRAPRPGGGAALAAAGAPAAGTRHHQEEAQVQMLRHPVDAQHPPTRFTPVTRYASSIIIPIRC